MWQLVSIGDIADNLSKAGWSWGCLSALDREGRTIWIANAHRDDGKLRRLLVRGGWAFRDFLNWRGQTIGRNQQRHYGEHDLEWPVNSHIKRIT